MLGKGNLPCFAAEGNITAPKTPKEKNCPHISHPIPTITPRPKVLGVKSSYCLWDAHLPGTGLWLAGICMAIAPKLLFRIRSHPIRCCHYAVVHKNKGEQLPHCPDLHKCTVQLLHPACLGMSFIQVQASLCIFILLHGNACIIFHPCVLLGSSQHSCRLHDSSLPGFGI